MRFEIYVGTLEPEVPLTIAGTPTSASELPVEFRLNEHEAMHLGRVLRGALKVRRKNEVLTKAARRGAEFITIN